MREKITVLDSTMISGKHIGKPVVTINPIIKDRAVITFFKKYKNTIWSLVAIAITAKLSIFYFSPTFDQITKIIPIIGFILTIPVVFFWLSYKGPFLEIKGMKFHIQSFVDIKLNYMIIIAIIYNSGNSAAENCEGMSSDISGHNKKFSLWKYGDFKQLKTTINKKDSKELMLFGICEHCPDFLTVNGRNISVPKIIFPGEKDWPNPIEYRYLVENLDHIEYKFTVSSDKANPISAVVTYDIKNREIMAIVVD